MINKAIKQNPIILFSGEHAWQNHYYQESRTAE
jgi:hypothetical protein